MKDFDCSLYSFFILATLNFTDLALHELDFIKPYIIRTASILLTSASDLYTNPFRRLLLCLRYARSNQNNLFRSAPITHLLCHAYFVPPFLKYLYFPLLTRHIWWAVFAIAEQGKGKFTCSIIFISPCGSCIIGYIMHTAKNPIGSI